MSFNERNGHIWIIFDIEIDFECQTFAIFDNFYSTDRKT